MRFKLIFILALLPLLLCCRPNRQEQLPVCVTYPPATQTPASESAGETFLYDGAYFRLLRGYRKGVPGICVKELSWAVPSVFYVELPGVNKQGELIVTGVEILPDGEHPEAFVHVHYLDDDGQERIVCFDHAFSDWRHCYPLEPGSGLSLTDQQKRDYDDLLLFAYLYAHTQQETDRLTDTESWEVTAQWCILDGLYYNHGDALPHYIQGEGYVEDDYMATTIVSLAELDALFQSVLGRPCLLPEKTWRDEVWPDLQPGQIALPPTDYHFWTGVKQVTELPDGTRRLYGYGGMGEGGYQDMIICCISPSDGFLEWQIQQTELYSERAVAYDRDITLYPAE